jgi:hypothetical protein
MTRSQLADKIERQLSLKDQVVLSVAGWNTVIEALRENRAVSSDAMGREYVVSVSSSHGPR